MGRAFGQLVTVLSACGLAVVVFYGAVRVMRGQLSPGDLIVFAAYVKNLYSPIDDLSQLFVEFTESLVSGERLLEILHIDTHVREHPNAIAGAPFRGEIKFENVVFGYRTGETTLRNLSFTARPGQKVALVGSSGTGKSTVIALLLRFFDPWEGKIFIDGIDIRLFKLGSLRKQISVMLQDDLLFRRTIRENIAYGSPGAGLEEVEAAARRAQAHDFVMKLPQGYETVLEEGGRSLSGGQRQRIALARAMLKDSPIVVLDEPGTGLDAITEAGLRQNLQEFLRGKTSFVIAHSFPTIRDADLILVVEEGQAVGQGTHADLLVGSRVYRQLYELQSRTRAV